MSTPARASNIVQITGEDGGPYSAYHDCRRLAQDAARPEALAATVAGLNNAAIGACPHFAVHSGVVSWSSGIVAIPAESGNGKTTLTAALVQKGFDFLSDEALVFADDWTVLPYPKPIALSEWSAKTLGLEPAGEETLVRADDIGGRVGTAGQLTDLVLSEYGHEDTKLEELSKSQAVAALIQLSFNHFKNPERAFRIATGVAHGLRVWKLHYDSPIEAAELLSGRLR